MSLHSVTPFLATCLFTFTFVTGVEYSHMDSEKSELERWKSEAKRLQVAIVGGGISGLSSLKVLQDNGIRNVVLLEAQQRLGGRIKTIRDGPFLIEEGAQWIQGGPKNELHNIAKSLNALGQGFTFKDIDPEIKIFSGNGTKGDYLDYEASDKLDDIYEAGREGSLKNYYGKSLGQFFIDRFNSELSFGSHQSPGRDAWLHFLEQAVNSEQGSSDWNDVSARDVNAFTYFGKDYTWSDGFDTIITYLNDSIPPSSIRLGTPVRKIIWELDDQPGALVVTDSGSYLVDHVLVTVSIGHLKRHHKTLFSPSLPQEMQKTLMGMELGTANKVFIGWKDSWYDNKYFETRILWTERDLPKEMDWVYGIVLLAPVDKRVCLLMAFVTGNYSVQMEELPENVVKDHVLFLLRRIFKTVNIPEPTLFKRTTWISNPWFHGSYNSYVTMEGDRAGIRSREPLRQPLMNKWNQKVVKWAGEHTHDNRYGATDGAYETGIREANQIINEIKEKSKTA